MMANNLKHCVLLLHDNEEPVKQEAVKVLLKMCNNIIKNPKDSKYRKIFLSNAVVSKKLLPANGAIECLFEAGFIENDDGFLLPLNNSLTGIKELFELLNNLSKPKSVPTSITKQNSTTIDFEEEYHKIGFLTEMMLHFKNVIRFEDKNLQEKVKSIVPIIKFEINAMQKLRNIQKEIKITKVDDDIVIEDLILSELMSWFKNSFFQWVNSPECDKCSGECSYDRSIKSNNPLVSRIEIHRCGSCNYENKFVRYTHPEPLLYTRRGRCGEWALVFTLICRTMGFDARLVHDFTDHVWTEVWSVAHNRWIHADACENVMDSPLMYEKGWGKKLNYIIAYSRDEVQDVTWRYTQNYKDVLNRRTECSEETLIKYIDKLNKKRQNASDYSAVRKNFVIKRRALELADMLTAPPGCKKPCEESINESQYGGRTSGSLAWRLARGEMGGGPSEKTVWNIPTGTKEFELTYFIAGDKYIAKDITNDKILLEKKGWQNGVDHTEGGIFRKEELDWKMVYLARSEKSSNGLIVWSFNVEDSKNMCIEKIHFQATVKTFNNGKVVWKAKGINEMNNEKEYTVSIPNCENVEVKDLKSAIKLSINASLYGGEGDSAWQHAQLFRTSLKENINAPSMVIRISLSKKLKT
ncbi:peptide-N(4)-(N-acetyl-beta-glucosaminyl)asparagine amidase [Trichogramma pretiosum]|uniref:peptide-N(4)-(N-acetyl-beta- glucosaminyl)asparagine amidase n=1 Tax=Trichogramma pretiosum TaxID=7493 RepID=UPI0006C9BCA5|nr:peptide-N(4)-(N-acetyl-beta-glucosaminyl)asparagine amidase [Trichogramma pretiosum]XP_023317330.1 peptide-N(4)-(N-acetyl-beta-glucosaminyl)asparagine amidase [Trichogramma pretiosum]XP_023317331.1 peptide-N(4)-(N-acetyl-beta-glucosaminyl)asparagine amidase [Trichogramma pretiosum]